MKIKPTLFKFGLVFVILSAVFLVITASSVSLFCKVSGWQIDAMPAALSHMLYDHPSDYTEFSEVGQRFRNALKGSDCKSVNAAIHTIREHAPLTNTQSATLGSDDKGVVDFVVVSFTVFGMNAESLPLFYFTVLFLSVVLLVSCFRKHLFLMSLMGLFLVCFGLTLPFVSYYGQLTSFLALRAFPTLGLVATLHLVLAAFTPERGKRWTMALLIQAAIIALVVHVRFAGMYQLITVTAAGVAAVLWAAWHRESWSNLRSRMMPMILSMAMVITVCMVEKNRMAEQYELEQQGAKHVFWHSLFSGLAFSETLQKEWNVKLDDESVITATRRYLTSTGRTADLKAIGMDTPTSKILWAPYDQAVKDMFLSVCRADMVHCLIPLIVTKPLVALEWVLWITQITSQPPYVEVLDASVKQQLMDTHALLAKKHALRTFSLVLLGFILAASALCSFAPRQRNAPVILALGFVTIGSLVPSIVAYPVAHVVIEFCILVWLMIASLIVIFLSKLGQKYIVHRTT